jgi:type I restriction-modification system DNA methylase subunit
MPVPQEISELIARFERNREAHLSGDYNETQLRLEFLNPFFAALGWDVENKQGFAEAYKDVVHEDAIKIGGGTKAPDYCFRIGGARKFFVEAKKPAINLNEDAGPAFQLRRYAWSAKLPLSILTNFAEFAVYDCREKPSQSDKASAGRTLYLRYSDYETRWEEISTIFSKEAVLKGSFDKYAETQKAKKGTAAVDQAFLKEIEAWREMLARNIALRNPQLTQREMNFVVQRTIDRIVFLRIGEDRGIETYGALLALSNGEHIYKRLCELFYRADERYNSELFHFQKEKGRSEAPDKLALELELDDKPLKDLINNLYYPDSPYEFSVLPADILGQVYEQFLGKVIRLTAGHRAVVEDKPEVKKAGGVYYTPTYIVDYIVKNTVGNLLEGKTPRQATKLRILDPACGSGSFLIGAYQYLLDWHRDWYVQDGAEKWVRGRSPALHQTAGGDWRLTTVERKQILLNNIYGVDIDPQAVEVTKLSLLLKVLEGENEQTISRQLKFFHERALPDLGNNIKCGNSLIGPDFYAQQQMQLPDDEDRYRLNVFDWQAEFPEIMKAGGFDAVIGNPPYVRIQTTGRTEVLYYGSRYKAALGNYDVSCLFVEKGVNLLGADGMLGFILPHRFFKTDYGAGLRAFIVDRQNLRQIIDFDGYMVFEQASINTCILILGKNKATNFLFGQVKYTKAPPEETAAMLSSLGKRGFSSDRIVAGPISLSTLSSEPWVFVRTSEKPVWKKLNQSQQRLRDITTHIFQGLKTSADSIYLGEVIKASRGVTTVSFKINDEEEKHTIESSIMKPLIKGGQMRRYFVGESSKQILFPYEDGALISPERMKRDFPKAWSYLLRHKTALENREDGKMQGGQWYAYGRSQALTTMSLPKIITPDYYAHASYCLDEEGKYYFCGGGAGGYGIVLHAGFNIKYVLGLLNSKLLDWYLHKITIRAYQTAYMYVRKYIEQLPIRPINFSDAADKSRHDRMVKLVEQMLALNQKLAAAKTGHEQTTLQRQIDATDQQIDALVYELYGVNEDEIRIMEGQA